MDIKVMKRILSLFVILLLFSAALLPCAFAAEGEDENEQMGTHFVREKIVDLGKIPDETKMEKRCEVLLVADVLTGVPVREKNVSLSIPITGATVQMMTVLTAMDYFTLDEWITVTEEQLRGVPSVSKVKLGLRAANEVIVSDLVAAMLLTGAADAAKVLADETVTRAGASSIGELMQQKADELGMTATNYFGCDGVCSDTLVITNAVDQCELYLTLLNQVGISNILATGTYETESRYDQDATAALADASADDGKKIKATTDENGRVLRKNNTNIPAVISNSVKAVVPEERTHDVRLSSAVSCIANTVQKDDHYGAVFFRTKSDRSDLAMLYWQAGASSKVPTNYLVYLADIFVRSKVVDLIPYVEVAATGLTIEKSGVKIIGWSLQPGHTLFGRVLSAYDPEAYAKANQEAMSDEYQLVDMKVVLKPDTGTLITNEDGSRTMQAKVMVDNSVEGIVTLETAPKVTQTTVSQNTNILYTEDDVMPEEPTLLSQYGWMIIIGGVVLLALIVIIIGVVIRNRMERW